MTVLGAVLVVGLLAAATGCTNREYLSGGILAEVQKSDPKLEMVRVYPSAKFIVNYPRDLDEDLSITSGQGAVRTDIRGDQIQYIIGRKLPGAIVGVDTEEGSTLLWVTFDPRCADPGCAYGFIQTDDALYRLVSVPKQPGYKEAEIYRKRVSKRKRMRKTKIFTKSRAVPVYFTQRGIKASIALEVKKTNRVDVTTVVVPQQGVPATVPVERQPSPEPDASPSP